MTSKTSQAPPTFEQSLRLAVKALRKVAHPLAFDAARYDRMSARDESALRAQAQYQQLHQAADLLDEQADDIGAARLNAAFNNRKERT